MAYLKSSGGGGSGWEIITSFSYASKNLNYGDSTYGDANAITFKPDGTKVYIVGESKNTVYQFSLSTPRDITTATYDNKSKSVSAQSTVSESIIFSKDGLTMWLGGNAGWSTNTAKVWKYTLSTAWDVSTATYANVLSNLSFNKVVSSKIYNNGQYLYVLAREDKKIFRYTMTTPYDITTLQGSSGQYQEFSISNIIYGHEVVLNPQGTQMFVLDRDAKKIYLYTLSTAWDLTTATLTGSYSISTPNSSNITSMCIDNNGESMYLGGYNIGGIYQYDTVLEWTPGANTTLYLPLNGDITDPYNQVTYNWVGTSSFATWSTGVQAANLTGSNAINLGASTDFEQGTGEMTALFWFTTNSPSTTQRCEFRNDSAYYFGMQISSSKLGFLCKNSSASESWVSGTTTLTSGTKYLAALTMKENGQAILYLNGNVETTINIGTFQTYSSQTGQHIGAGRTGNSEFWRGMIKDFIIEDKARTADEIAGYYYQTKSKYGL